MKDGLSETILKVVNQASEPLETKEVEKLASMELRNVTRAKLFYRLNMLRAEGSIRGKFVGPGKGVWIWWRKDAF